MKGYVIRRRWPTTYWAGFRGCEEKWSYTGRRKPQSLWSPTSNEAVWFVFARDADKIVEGLRLRRGRKIEIVTTDDA